MGWSSSRFTLHHGLLIHRGFAPEYPDTCRNSEALGQSARPDNGNRCGPVSPRRNKQDALENVTVSSSEYSEEEAEGEELWTGDKNVIETMTER